MGSECTNVGAGGAGAGYANGGNGGGAVESSGGIISGPWITLVLLVIRFN